MRILSLVLGLVTVVVAQVPTAVPIPPAPNSGEPLVVLVTDPSPEVRVTSVVSEVVLYRGQALVTRWVEVPAGMGSLELVVDDLPAAVQPNTLFAEAVNGVDLRAVRFRSRSVREAQRPEVRALEDRRAGLKAELENALLDLKFAQARMQRIERLDGMIAAQGKSDLEQGKLDAEALERLVKFATEETRAIMKDVLQHERERDRIKGAIEQLERELAEIASQATKVVREAVLFVDKSEQGQKRIRLSYLVSQCGWSPSYIVRADSSAKKVELDYQAIISQATGESWDAVSLTLSTATPALSAAGPVLAPFAVTLRPRQPQAQTAMVGGRVLNLQLQELQQRKEAAVSSFYNATNTRDNTESAWVANDAANQLQNFELQLGSAFQEIAASTDGGLASGPSLNYEIAGRVSLASRSDQQMVRIARKELGAEFAALAMPVLSPHIHREAAVRNASGLDFLRGPVSVYLDRRFVGQAEIGDVAAGQGFTIGLGVDPRMRARRELARRDESVQGGNRIIDTTVKIEIDNFYGDSMVLRVYDRVPYLPGKSDLRVTHGKSTVPLSTDADYLREERPFGILRFDVTVSAAANGKDAMILEHDFKLEFDRNADLASPSPNEEPGNRELFERILRGRNP